MKGFLFVGVLLAAGSVWAQDADSARWAAEASRVTIVRDDWGIAHVHGKSDADAVFGMIYAQCEDDFNRVESNYLTSLGRTAEAEGESRIWQDLRQRLFIDPEDLKKDYAISPPWLKRLTDAWADGANFYLAKHPEVKPKVITHFEPWMAFSFTEGSIGGDIERVNLRELEAFYSKPPVVAREANTGQRGDANQRAFVEESAGDGEPRGSNGIAIAPSNTVNHHALLLINPHTSFFFRSELQMSSDEGLDAYGAVTWGQFFIYQGFNTRAGWMHTSSGVDAVDEFLETVSGSGPFKYTYGKETRQFDQKQIAIAYKTASGVASRTFTAFYSTHGPVTHQDGGKWVTMKLMNIPVPALEQSYLRTKARSYKEYVKTMELQANSSNNTIFADSDGDIAYWHGNFIPKRDTKFDFTKPVDGSDPATDWHGLLTLAQTPQLHNPKSGYLFNVNNAPWWGAGESSLKKSDFPAYVEMGGESARGLHAIRILTQYKAVEVQDEIEMTEDQKRALANAKDAPREVEEVAKPRRDFTLESLMTAAYDSYLPWFDKPIAALEKAWAALPLTDPLKQNVSQEVAALRGWSQRWSASSQATSLAVYWGQALQRTLGADARKAGMPVEEFAGAIASGEQLMSALRAAADRLTADFGTWKIAWGSINRFQRLTGDIAQPFNDAAPSIPVPFPSSVWGSLASFGARQYPGTKKWYGTSGNSFVAVVEFGDKVRARAVTAGGESGHPESKHFDDEADRYASGKLRDVYFYPEQLTGHTERTYKPGE
jgi:acyl-homoserine lactone acylase PvdQ